MLEIRSLPVGSWQANCYLVLGEAGSAALIDPGDQAEAILNWIGPVKVSHILLTHGHRDHVGALRPVHQALGAPVGIHPADAERFEIRPHFYLKGGDEIRLGAGSLQVVHLPGHTPGSLGFKLIEGESFQTAIVGDAVFPGGPGRTNSPADLETALEALARTVFTWDDTVRLFPGHGEPTTVGAERAGFEALRGRPRPPDLYGDVTWESLVK